MEIAHVRAVAERFPEAASRTFLLGLLDPDGDPEIADPDGGSPAAFERAFGQVERSVDALCAAVSRRSVSAGPARG